MEGRPKWRTYTYYVLGVLLVLFMILNKQGVAPHIIIAELPKMPLGIWLFICFLGGFFLGRAFPRKKKIKEKIF